MSDETKVTITHTQAVNRLKDINDELQRLGAKDDLTDTDSAYWSELTAEFDAVDKHRRQLERQADLDRISVVAGSQRSQLRIERGSDGGELDADPIGDPSSAGESRTFKNPWDLSEVRTFNRSQDDIGQELRARALSAIEQMRGMSQARREGATKIIEEFDNDKGTISRMALATSSPEYMRAFAKAARGQEHTQTPEERDAVQRAMSLTDAAGGYLVPFQLDPTVIITSDGSLNEIRRAARRVVATGDTWYGVSAGETSWSWDAEVAEASDDASTFAQPSVPIYKGVGFVPISLEALQDEQNVSNEVGRLLARGKDTLEATAFATGSGSGQPTGIVTALTGGASEVASAAADTFAIGDVYNLQGQLPAGYRSGASWLANNLIYNLVRQFDTAGGAGMWERIGNDRPPELLGRPAYEAEAMDGTITAAAENYVAVFGDFMDYVIADRIGITVEFIPHLFATGNNRPSGQRGWYAYFRAGADSVNDGAFRMLNVT